MPKRSNVLECISKLIREYKDNEDSASLAILTLLETAMTPKARPLTVKELNDHDLVKQAPKDRKDEIMRYVSSLDYEWKNEWEPE